MNLLFICQAVDDRAPLLGSTLAWLRELDRHVDSTRVLALDVAGHDLPGRIVVRRFRRTSRAATLAAFYREILLALRTRPIDAILVYMGGPYPLLLAPLRFLGPGLFQWRCGPRPSWVTRLGTHCLHRIFTATAGSAPIRSPRVRVVGHGIEVDLFPTPGGGPRRDLCTVSGLHAIKRIDFMLEVVAELRELLDEPPRLVIYGPVRNTSYVATLERTIGARNLEDLVSFAGAVPHRDVPEILRRHAVYLNYSRGGLDKAVLEAMASGTLVLSSNDRVAETLPVHLRDEVILRSEDPHLQARRLADLLTLDDERRRSLGAELRQLVLDHHAVDRLVRGIVAEMSSVMGRSLDAAPVPAPSELGLPSRWTRGTPRDP